jgi:hypothetical protein
MAGRPSNENLHMHNLPTFKASILSDEKIVAEVKGHMSKLHALLRSALVADDTDLAETFNASDLGKVKEIAARATALLATGEKRKRDERKGKLRDVLFSHPAFQGAMSGQIALRDAFATMTEEQRSLAKLTVPTDGYVSFNVAKLAIVSAWPGTTDEQITADLRAIGIECVAAGRGQPNNLKVSHEKYAEWQKMHAEKQASANGAATPTKKAKEATAS